MTGQRVTLSFAAVLAAAGLAGAAMADEIVIGTAGPITGQYAIFGE